MKKRHKVLKVKILGSTSIIELRNAETIIDTKDLYLLEHYGFWLGSNGYIKARKLGGKRGDKEFYLHRLIVGSPNNFQIDHKNRNILDNRRSNLRVCTKNENARNSKMRKHNTSGYRGVSWFRPAKKWRSTIVVNGKQKSLGYYNNPMEAAIAYNDAAKELHGDFAVLNIL